MNSSEKIMSMKPSLTTSVSKSFYAIICGLVLLTLGIMLTFSKAWVLKIILPEFILKPNSVIEEFWRKPPIKIPTNVYMFNWTNSEDLYNTSIKPNIQQVGPYRFFQNMEKVNIIWNDNNTVTYNQVRTWQFDEDHPSNGNMSDTITQINLLALCSAHTIRYWSYFYKAAFSTILSSTSFGIYVTKSVKEILLETYDSTLRDMIENLVFLAPEMTQFNAYGLISYRNASPDIEGVINMSNGVNGNFEIFNVNYNNETSVFQGQCSKIRGSIGELQSPIQNKDHIVIFFPEVCRPLVLDYEEDVVVNGFLGYKYSLGNTAFDNGTLVPENKCYCVDECTPFGMLNTSNCLYGLPVYISLPHFYQGNLADFHLDGLHPDKSKHETYVIVEPQLILDIIIQKQFQKTGIPLKAVVRIQFNLLLHPIDGVEQFEDVPKIYFPVAWGEMEIMLPDEIASLLRFYLNVPIIYSATAYTLMTSGVFILAVALVCRKQSTLSECNMFYKRKESVSLKPEEVPLKNCTRAS